ncbi:MAG TPA: T9SS type A sorting domain-containing protein [Moheibacter sp.]|nr:T9SS type A sorting domain-containing protein [Moheibacter sp.]
MNFVKNRFNLNKNNSQKTTGQDNLNVQDLAPGNYLLTIKYQDGGTETKKFIKKQLQHRCSTIGQRYFFDSPNCPFLPKNTLVLF